MTQDARDATACWVAVALSAVIVGAVTVNAAVVDGSALPGFFGTDTYARMVRVVDLWQGGAWFEARYDRILPDGLVSHWTRPLDVLIILCALPFMPVMDAPAALHWGGFIVAPVLCVVAVGGLAFALRPLLGAVQTTFAALALLFIAPIIGVFVPGRPDHYPPLILAFVLILWGLVRLMTEARWRRGAVAVGLGLPLAIWVNISGVLLALAIPVVLGVRWLVSGDDWGRRNVWVAAAAVAGTIGALVIERPPLDAVTAVEFDRLSLWHLSVFVAVLAFWMALGAVERRRPGWTAGRVGRAAVAAPLAVVGLAALLALFPQVLGPDQGIPIDPLYERVRLVRIDEYQPLLSAADLASWGRALTAMAEKGAYFGAAALGLVGLALLLVRGPGPARWVWGTLIALAAVYMGLTWPPNAAWMPLVLAFLAPGYGVLVAGVFEALGALALPIRVPARVAATILVMFAPFGVQRLAAADAAEPGPNLKEVCAFTGVADWIAATMPAPPRLNIMAVADMGSELMYRTPHRVYAMPNHRLQPGFTTTWEVMTADDAATARGIATGAGVDLLVVCDTPGMDGFFTDADSATDFRSRLLAGERPDWLRPLELPARLGDALHVYRVVNDPG
ncbi:hypothetical protein [Roseospira goensis]|uniref:Uncharacterized protein n=1 Tax=Roseospira goensis TaxID=391922 RepID=A0A7W6S2P4_9PROT|nr:hypothetical protein [Roseospira goensis]MBB4287094.1 hypothetical protein [Roseospira goensis]